MSHGLLMRCTRTSMSVMPPHTMAHRRSDGPSDLKNWWGHLNRENKFISRCTHGHTRKHRVNTLDLFL